MIKNENEFLVKVVNDWQLSAVLVKSSILSVWQAFEYVFAFAS